MLIGCPARCPILLDNRGFLPGHDDRLRERSAPGKFLSVSIDLKSLTREELEARMVEWGQPRFRATQVTEWVYQHDATEYEAMTNLPKRLRARLANECDLVNLELISRQGAWDTTQKFLWRLPDGAMIESVLIPANPALYGGQSDRHTLCVSTQVGCAYGCRFCASGLDGWKRNLSVGEIVDQVLATERWYAQQENGSGATGERLIDNLVIMGMGEPLANYSNLMKALKILNAQWGRRIGARKITISTSGLVPQIKRLAEEPFQFRLAISLHGATNPVRDRIMPINRKFPLEKLIDACETYQHHKGKMITLEYILIADVNDGVDQTAPLAALAKRLHAKVNLIPYNRVEGLPWERPSESAQEAFLEGLAGHGARATLRREKGHDIEAACGQLRLRKSRESETTQVVSDDRHY